MHHRFHHTRTGEGFIAYDRIRPIQSAKRFATEAEAAAEAAKMKAEQDDRDARDGIGRAIDRQSHGQRHG